jgi:hypothetical protein
VNPLGGNGFRCGCEPLVAVHRPVGGVLGPVGAPYPFSWGLLPTVALMLG